MFVSVERQLANYAESGAVMGDPARGEIAAVALAEIIRLRTLLTAHRLDPDRCGNFPKGEQCALRHGHDGPCKWHRGD